MRTSIKQLVDLDRKSLIDLLQLMDVKFEDALDGIEEVCDLYEDSLAGSKAFRMPTLIKALVVKIRSSKAPLGSRTIDLDADYKEIFDRPCSAD